MSSQERDHPSPRQAPSTRKGLIRSTLGLLLIGFGFVMVPPIAVAYLYREDSAAPFVIAFFIHIVIGSSLWLFRPLAFFGSKSERPARAGIKDELRIKDGFVIVAMFWLVLGISGSIPLALSPSLEMSVTDAIFESVSGLTTTGATVITGLDDLPKAILFYRQLLQWLGGMGIIVLAVAIVPMLGIGGMQLYRAETPGPIKESRLKPRIAGTAKALWVIYLVLTLACAGAYHLAGMGGFDAISHALSTVSIGGFSTHDASLGHFDDPWIEMVAIVFMIAAGMNFALHFKVWNPWVPRWRKDSLHSLPSLVRSLPKRIWNHLSLAHRTSRFSDYREDPELRFYLLVLVAVAAICSAILYLSGIFEEPWSALRKGVFQAVSISTTTGFTTTSYHAWPGFLPVLLIFASFVGGCASSTGGGLKAIRVLMLFKQMGREITRLVHPNALVPVKIGATVLPTRVIDAVWGFFAAYVLVFSLLLLALMMTGLDQVTAFSAVAACINNMGPGLGDVGQHYASINDFAKWLLALAMLLGRLEIFTLLVLMSPTFWRD
ncbi:MAG: potassium transporter [Ectothiorhodospiraceae bacterium AqS1]|nr:potassium transporter [Ectothiorhodospiraceae bacterium AqS1]